MTKTPAPTLSRFAHIANASAASEREGKEDDKTADEKKAYAKKAADYLEKHAWAEMQPMIISAIFAAYIEIPSDEATLTTPGDQ